MPQAEVFKCPSCLDTYARDEQAHLVRYKITSTGKEGQGTLCSYCFDNPFDDVEVIELIVEDDEDA